MAIVGMHSVRRATGADAVEIGPLVRRLVGDSLLDPTSEEAQRFYETLEPAEVAKAMALPNRFYAVAEVGREVCGMIMVRDGNHVGQFFVHENHQGKGIGSALWRFALASVTGAGGSGKFTVRSSVSAEPVYRRLGFVPTGPVQVQQGFRFIPMLRAGENAASPPAPSDGLVAR